MTAKLVAAAAGGAVLAWAARDLISEYRRATQASRANEEVRLCMDFPSIGGRIIQRKLNANSTKEIN